MAGLRFDPTMAGPERRCKKLLSLFPIDPALLLFGRGRGLGRRRRGRARVSCNCIGRPGRAEPESIAAEASALPRPIATGTRPAWL